jgi:hypothetical protein
MLKLVKAGQVTREAHAPLLGLLSPSDAVLASGAMERADREREDEEQGGGAAGHITNWNPESGVLMPPAPAKNTGGKAGSRYVARPSSTRQGSRPSTRSTSRPVSRT